jgi:hypothetical protein
MVDLQTICAKYVLVTWNPQIMLFVMVCSTWGIIELKTRFETWRTRNGVNGVNLLHHSYLITLMAYLCTQSTPKFKFKYFMFDLSIYSLYVLNGKWKHDPLQIISVNVCSTWRIVELKTCFETWLRRKDVNSVSLFDLCYLITHMTYLFS